jgi:hypothetical protein
MEQPTDKPDQRSFGSQLVKKGGVNLRKFGLAATVVASLAVVTVGGFAIYPILAAASAPKMTFNAVQSQVAPKAVASVPVAAASAPAAGASAQVAAGGPVIPVVSREEEARNLIQSQFAAMNLRVDQLTEELASTKAIVIALRKKTKPAPVAAAEPEQRPDDLLALTVVEINPKTVVVSDSTKQYSVGLGASLPGGATFIGYDPVSRLMKTDRGDFLIN